MTIEDVYRALWRSKFLIAALTALLVGLAYWLTSREQPVYAASTLVRVQPRIDNAGEAFSALATGQKLAQTYATIAATRTIAVRIEQRLGGSVPLSAIQGHVSGQALQDLDLLRINVRGASPAVVQQIANAAPAALKDYISETGTLRDSVTTAERAILPTAPSSPSKKKNMLLALILGFILNCGLALGVRALRDPVGNPDEIERTTKLPVLATIPRLRFARTPGKDRLPAPSPSAQEQLSA